MTASLINGNEVATSIKSALKQLVIEKKAQGLEAPGLAVVLVGDDPASKIYTDNKKKACEKIGFNSYSYCLKSTINEHELLNLIYQLNQDTRINGILVQLPLPKTISSQRIIEAIAPDKDIDGFHPYNLGRLVQRHPTLRPCTPFGIIKLFDYYQLPIKSKRVIVVGASNIVGRPLSMEFLLAGATVTICNSHSKNLDEIINFGEIIVAATGKMDLINPNWLRKEQVLIDVGIHRLANGKLRGDIDFDQAKDKVSWITPVPGGVGPMTIASLLHNTARAAYGFDAVR